MHISCSTSASRTGSAPAVTDPDPWTGAPVGEPEPPVVPARRLPEHDLVHPEAHARQTSGDPWTHRGWMAA